MSASACAWGFPRIERQVFLHGGLETVSATSLKQQTPHAEISSALTEEKPKGPLSKAHEGDEAVGQVMPGILGEFHSWLLVMRLHWDRIPITKESVGS